MENFKTFIPFDYEENCIFTFDIETTSYWQTPNGVQGYTEDFTPEEYNNFPVGACCYIWQFSINENVYYGRYLKDFPLFLDIVFSTWTHDKPPIIWVHNLAWEWQFINEYLNINLASVFARTARKPMKFLTYQYGSTASIEFRCSYMLTRLSLETWGNELGVPKLVGALDYCIIRTPLTKLSDLELKYCEMDCIVVYNGIKQFLKKYGSLHDIPLTQTGEVRFEIRQHMQEKAYNNWVTTQLPRTIDEYKLLRAVFQGGSCGANYLYADKVLYGVGSDDLQSDYPSQMCSKKYPCTRFIYCSPSEVKPANFDKYAFIICIAFEGLTSKTCLHYYSKHKAVSFKNAQIDNGKIISCDKLVCILTEQDLLIFRQCYSWEKLHIIKCFKAKKQYLPKKLIEIILERYEFKTTLKGNDEKKEIYAQSKQFINSLYGCCVTDPIQPHVTFNGQQWTTADGDALTALSKMQCNRSKNFLSYAWGCWVTAYARRWLWIGTGEMDEKGKCITGMLAMPKKVVYWDTDSRKTIRDKEVEKILAREDKYLEKEMRDMCKYYDIPFSKVKPKDPKGNERFLGKWDYEGDYDGGFITLGAKRYATKKYGQIEVTISGVPKKAGSDMLKDLNDFKDGLIFDANHVDENGMYDGKKLAIYLDGNNLHTTLNAGQYDEYKTDNMNGIALRNNGYKLGLTDEYILLVMQGMEKGVIK